MMISSWHHHVVRPSVCNAMNCGSEGRCTWLKVVPVRSYNRQAPICSFRHFCCVVDLINKKVMPRTLWPFFPDTVYIVITFNYMLFHFILIDFDFFHLYSLSSVVTLD